VCGRGGCHSSKFKSHFGMVGQPPRNENQIGGKLKSKKGFDIFCKNIGSKYLYYATIKQVTRPFFQPLSSM